MIDDRPTSTPQADKPPAPAREAQPPGRSLYHRYFITGGGWPCSSDPKEWMIPILSIVLGFLAFVWVTESSRDYGYTIDEPTYVWVAREARSWAWDVWNEGAAACTPERIRGGLHALEPHGSAPPGQHSNFNLPAPIWLWNLGWLVANGSLEERYATRLGPQMLFALTVAITCWVISKQTGRLASGIIASLGLLASPRLFGHAHFTAVDAPLACLSLMTLFAVSGLVRPQWSLRAALLVSLLCGVLASLKLAAWFLGPAILTWLLLARPAGWRRTLAIVSVLVPAVFLILTPHLWHDPIFGLIDHLRTAAHRPGIASVYGGQVFMDDQPPMSTFLLLGTTVPIAWLMLSVVSLAALRKYPLVALLWLGLVAWILARILLLVPHHDGERQILPALAMIGVLAGFGADRLFALVERGTGPRVGPLAVFLLSILLVAEPLIETVIHRAHGLVYWNRLIGGLPGAAAQGHEVSYWYEAMTDDDWRRFADALPPGSRVFFRPDHPGLPDLTHEGLWRSDLIATGPRDADYHLFYAKRAAYAGPDEVTGTLMLTRLAHEADTAPALVEIRFQGVRLAALIRARP